ncbi:hypothetical protein N9488_00215 [Flavobacteriales bacterium]|jgi:hypothetical protein|nr:hypothetical protein [Flavobacteriales bacterium]MDB4195674.1 hypothetical protein [Flavobacteriales bacterium]MDB9932022.1 hypothetical protein [Flavobacteriales bacterium]
MLKSFIIISFTTIAITSGNKYQKFFSEDYDNGLKILEKYDKRFSFICNNFKVTPNYVKSIVFPETIRYNTFKDFFETSSLELLYINNGSEAVDFSIGYFQMKPSFIEELEVAVKNSSDYLKEKYKSVYSFNKESLKDRRIIRLQRLKNIDCQITYICCFFDLLDLEYPNLKENETEMIQFYSSAYNFGFKKPPEKIKAWSKVKAFPYGSSFDGEQFSYSELSLHFLQK